MSDKGRTAIGAHERCWNTGPWSTGNAARQEESPAEMQLAGERSETPEKETNMTIFADTPDTANPQFAGTVIPIGIPSPRFLQANDVNTMNDGSILVSNTGRTVRLETLNRDGLTTDMTFEIAQETTITAAEIRIGDPYLVLYAEDEIRLTPSQARQMATALAEYASFVEEVTVGSLAGGATD